MRYLGSTYIREMSHVKAEVETMSRWRWWECSWLDTLWSDTDVDSMIW